MNTTESTTSNVEENTTLSFAESTTPNSATSLKNVTTGYPNTIESAVTSSLSIFSSSLATQSYDTAKQPPTQNQSLIIGLAAGIPSCVALILAVGLIVLYIRMKRNRSQGPPKESRVEQNTYVNNVPIPIIPRPALRSEPASDLYDDAISMARPNNNYELVMPTFDSVYESALPVQKQ
ncbi:hypothetical protein FKM82_015122 [Ascaphus truei]